MSENNFAESKNSAGETMEIVTGMGRTVSTGDRVAIKRLDQEAEETIYVGKVTDVNGGHLDTTIPGNTKTCKYEVLGVTGESRIIPDEAKNWIERYENSQYQMFLKAEKRDSGNIQIEGV